METKHWDVIIVGGGLAGLLTDYFLEEQGIYVLVLHAKEIASGQTGRTTAKITSQHGLKYDKLIKKVGLKKAGLYARANEEAIREYEQLVKKEQIDCRFERLPAYLYARKQRTSPNEQQEWGELQKSQELQEQNAVTVLYREAEAAVRLGIDAYVTDETELPFPVVGAVCFPGQAQFSALDFVRQLSAKLEIREHTMVTAVKGNRVYTENEVLTADDIVIATHYPFKNVPGFYFLRQHQERSYVLALKKCEAMGCDETDDNRKPSNDDRKPGLQGMYYSINQDGFSLRRLDDLLLLGGSAHRTGQSKPGGAYEPLLQAAKKYFPGYEVKAAWSAQDCMPHDGIPFIGKYSVFTPHLYVATGFQKWGMTTSMIAALLLRDEICGIQNPYETLFSPQRMNFRASIGNLLIDIGMSVKGLLGGLFCKKEGRCSHMGCKLEWNPEEKSWDCPCHGSRFDAEGKLLDNPSRHDLW